VEIEAEVETQDGGETEAKQIETKGVETMELTEERLNEMVAAAAQQGAEMALKSLPVETKPAGVVTVTTDEADQPWERPGDFIKAVKSAYLRPMDEDPRLRSKKATGMSEGVPADGGYLVPEQMAGGILDRIYNVSQILSRISSDPVTGNNMSYNGVDETTHVGSMYGGILGYWIAEAGTITASRPKFYQMRLQLKEIAALAYATNDQLEDTPALDSWLTRTVPNVLRFQIEDAIIEGDGVGKPLGIMNSPSLVTAFRTDHTNFQLADVLTMYSRRWIGVNDYVWLVNQDVTPKLNAMTAATAPVYLPGGTVEGRPYGTLMGYPVIESEYCKTLYDTGDIVLASLSQYQAITKASGMKFASSLELAFVTNEKAFRWIMRIDGAPMWHSALTPLHGTNTVSPFVTCSSASS
jgi:HK97 family phage major capsid protein